MVGQDLSSLIGKTLEVAGQVVGFTLRGQGRRHPCRRVGPAPRAGDDRRGGRAGAKGFQLHLNPFWNSESSDKEFAVTRRD